MKVVYLFCAVAVFFTSCKEQTADENQKITITNFDNLKALDVKLDTIPGDWLSQHYEVGQTFNQYVKKNPIKSSTGMDCIYILPIGDFSEWEFKVVQFNAEYLHLFFGLKVKTMQPISDTVIPKDKKRMQFGVEQLDASYIIHEVLPDELPNDGIVIMALTAKDLYPKPSWNFVFGLASYTERTGVTSMYRFSDLPLDENNYSKCLSRLIKTSSHEITHMFSVKHCINAVCLMNGVNHLGESDRRPNALCSECLAKLSWNFNFKDVERLKEIIVFLKKHELYSDAEILEKQLDVINN